MKKVFLLAMLFAATVCNAQVVLWDGTDKEVGSDGGFWNRADPTVVEEEGNMIMKFTLKANPGGWDKEHCNAGLPLGDANLKGLRRLTMRVKMDINHNVLVRLVKDGSYSTGRLFWCGTENEWNILTFEFAAGPEMKRLQIPTIRYLKFGLSKMETMHWLMSARPFISTTSNLKVLW